MRAKITVVIPTLNAAASLPECLATLMEGVAAGLIRELVIADGGSADTTSVIASEAGAELVQSAPSRGGQLRCGAEAAGGEWLLFLHADTRLPEGWTDTVKAHLETGRPACFRLTFDAKGAAPFLVAGWANLRSRLFKLPYGDQGLLISRQEYASVGGYPGIPLMEDVAMVRKLGARLIILPLAITTSAARYRREGWMLRGLRNLSLLARYLAGADPERLARRY